MRLSARLGRLAVASLTLMFAGALPAHADRGALTLCGLPVKASATKVRCLTRQVRKLHLLKQLPHLKTLIFTRSGLKRLDALKPLKGLESLSIDYTAVSDLKPLESIPGLKELVISNTRVRRLDSMAHLSQLQSLTAWNAAIRDLSPLSGLKKLKHLVLGGTRVESLVAIRSLKSLRALNIERTQVKDLSPLLKLPQLRFLYLAGTPLTKEEVASFRRSLPKVKIAGCDGKGSHPCLKPLTFRLPEPCASILKCCSPGKRLGPACQTFQRTIRNYRQIGATSEKQALVYCRAMMSRWRGHRKGPFGCGHVPR